MVRGLVLQFCSSTCSLITGVALACSSANAQQVLLRGQLVGADTKKPLANVIISASSKTRPPRRVQVRTGLDGSFVVPAELGLPYALCSEAVGTYISTCAFSKPATVIAKHNTQPILLSAPAGIRIRVQIHDPGRRIRVSRTPQLFADPLDLCVYAEESTTRTRIPLAINSQTQEGFEYQAVIPATRVWRLAMSSVRFQLIQSAGRPYVANSSISSTAVNAVGEFLAVFSIIDK